MFDTEESELEMSEKASYTDRAPAWFFCREEKIMYLQTKCMERLARTVAVGLPVLHLCTDGGDFPSKLEAFEKEHFPYFD